MKRAWQILMVAMLAGGCMRDVDTNAEFDDANVSGPAWQGRWVVINYWAEWCKPCLEEIPELNAFGAAYPEQVLLVGVNYDGVTGEALQPLIEKFTIDFPVIEDPAGTLGYPRPQVLPTTIILAPDGSVANTLIGPQTQASLLEATGLDAPAPGAG